MKAIRFGRQNHLVGVLHEKPGSKRAALLWNTGTWGRMGPFRSNVEIARLLVEQGYQVLRFDLSGFGDSEMPDENLTLKDRTQADLDDAVHWLKTHAGAKTLLLVGICSSAVDAYHLALRETAVHGLIMVDSFVYPTPQHERLFKLQRLMSVYRWQRFFQQKVLRRPEAQVAQDYFESEYPAPAEASAGLNALLARQVSIYVLYTGGFAPFFSYKKQFYDMLPGLKESPGLALHHWKDVDHLFMLKEDRQRFLQSLSRWLQKGEKQVALPSGSFAKSDVIPSKAESKAAERPAPVAELLACMNDILAPSVLTAQDSFFDFGGTSALALKLLTRIEQTLGVSLNIAAIYSAPTAEALARACQGEMQARPLITPTQNILQSDAIAIIGMACHVPGARTLDQLWSMIVEKKDAITHFQANELDGSLPEAIRRHPQYVASRGVIAGDRFDAPFFGISRREADLLDPQQRILLQCAYNALEDSGYAAKRSSLRVASYLGVGANSYLTRNLSEGHISPHSDDESTAFLLNDKDYVATRVAYHLDLRGPAVSVHTACSSSLVAVIEAIDSLRAGRADLALAGAASVNAPIASGHLYQDGGIFSRDGQCRPFDAKASGTLFSDGAAVVVLKPLSRALADGDLIHAVIRGTGLNNDGAAKTSFAAPSVNGQAQAIASALAESGFEPASIGYIECHGTATPIGDPIELAGLGQVYGSAPRIAIGSIKANIGHLTAAAGTIGLIKAALALRHGIKPPQTHFEAPHPNLQIERTPFQILKDPETWTGVRRAAVSSFGVGGTNAHLVLEAAPTAETAAASVPPIDPWLTLPFSAQSAASLQLYGEWLGRPEDNSLAHLAYTLSATRETWTLGAARTYLHGHKAVRTSAPRPLSSIPQTLAFVFPGQGSQYGRMGLELANHWPRFARLYSQVLDVFEQQESLALRRILGDEKSLGETRHTQPALFALEWALGQALLDLGLKPSYLLGHSLGELSAAALAGVFSLPDAVRLVTVRARCMQASAPGAMLAVRAKREQIAKVLNADCELAAENSAQALVLSGPESAISEAERVLSAQGLAVRRLKVERAFHSRLMEPALAAFRDELSAIKLSPPRLPILSTVTGELLKAEDATSVDYWLQQVRKPVLFAKALQTLKTKASVVTLEIGPKDALSRFAESEGLPAAIASLPQRESGEVEDLGAFFSSLQTLGHPLFVPKGGVRISAPPYAFAGERHWLEPKARTLVQTHVTAVQSGGTRIGQLRQMAAQLLGRPESELRTDAAWAELGMDSLTLTQWALRLAKEFQTSVSLRQLQKDWTTLDALAAHLGAPEVSQAPAPMMVASGQPQEQLAQHIAWMQNQIAVLSQLLQTPWEAKPQVASAGPASEFVFHTDRGEQRAARLEGAFLAIGPDGQPAVYVPDAEQPGSFKRVDTH